MEAEKIREIKAPDIACLLVEGDSSLASALLPDYHERVSLACTSPPYSNAISYDRHSDDPTANYRDRPKIDYGDYLRQLDLVWTETWKMLKPGGWLAINAGTVLEGGRHTPLPQDITLHLLDADVSWEYKGTILWNKVTAGVKRAGSVIQHPFPGYWHPNIMTEHIVLVRKPGREVDEPSAGNLGYPESWDQPIWDIAPVPPGQVPHPAPFPEEIPHRLITMYSRAGDFVMDPFNGAGATTKAAWDLGRNSIGFDLQREYLDYAESRLSDESGIRRQQLAIKPVPAPEFVPRNSRKSNKTRHGAGLATARKRLAS